MPQLVDDWGRERDNRRNKRKRDYLDDNRDYVESDWTVTFYKCIFPAMFAAMLIVNSVISWPVMMASQQEYLWYNHWSIVIAFGFTIAVLACIYYYFIDRE